MPKPASTPDWDATGNTSEPAGGKKTAGYDPEDPLPAQELNWFWALVSEWILYLDGLWDEAITWTADHIFEQDVEIQGALILGTRTRNVMLPASAFTGSQNNGAADNVWRFLENTSPGAEDPTTGAWWGPFGALSGIGQPDLLAKVWVPAGAVLTELSVSLSETGAGTVEASVVGKTFNTGTGTWTTREILTPQVCATGVTTVAIPANTVGDGESVEVRISPTGTTWNADTIKVYGARVKYTHVELVLPT